MVEPALRHAEPKLLIFDVQRFSIHDGPGIRTTVFVKGCPLRCRWCQNPESLTPRPEVAFYADRCLQCGACATACSNGAIRQASSKERITRERCQACGSCSAACPTRALRLIGRQVPVNDLMDEILADQTYYQASEGGVTLSGGEPLRQPAAVAALLAHCREAGLSTLVETCGAVDWAAFETVLPWTDCFFYDLKAGEDELHRALTGWSSEPIIANARRLHERGAAVQFRMPLVPGENDTPESLAGVARTLKSLGHHQIFLLPYHDGGETKLPRIGSTQPRLGIDRLAALSAQRGAVKIFGELGIEAIGVALTPEDAAPLPRRFSRRVWRLREAVQTARPAVCAERARLVTKYFRDHADRDAPRVVQRAEALRYILGHWPATIFEGELLVGNFSSKRVGGSVLPELHGVAMLEDLFSFGSRAVNPLHIGPRERWILATQVMPYWIGRFLVPRAFPLPRALRFAADQLRGRRYLINETGGISHIVPDYAKLLRKGTQGLAAEARQRDREATTTRQHAFYRAVTIVCRGLERFASRYADRACLLAGTETDLRRLAELNQIAEICQRVPRQPAQTLQEALQSLLFAQIAINLESLDNSVCPGRLDQVLQPYYQADCEAGRIDEDRARELVGCFTVKMSEIVPVFSRRLTRFHGGLFNGQVVVVGGVDREGRDATNDLTWMFLEAMDQLRMRQPNFHARFHRDSPRAYVRRAADMLLGGSGAPSLMNDDAVVPLLVDRGMALEDARDYSPIGCVEPAACGKTFGSTDAALMNLPLCLERTLGTRAGGANTGAIQGCDQIDDLLHRFGCQVDHLVSELIVDLQAIERANAEHHPTPLSSALLQGCLESGLDASWGGTCYNASGVQAVGVADVADSLAAIDQVLFVERRCGWDELLAALAADFVGYEVLQARLIRAPKFGNDDPRVDHLAHRIAACFASSLARFQNTRGGPYLAGFYSVTAHSAFGESTGALPSGRPSGRPLANGLSPANGWDRLGPTASLNSVTNIDLRRHARNGINVNLKLDPTSLGGDAGVDATAGLIQGYFARGGLQVQLNVLNPSQLLEAQKHPDRHPWLLVRVSGYSAYFADLSPAMQQEIIDRTLHGQTR